MAGTRPGWTPALGLLPFFVWLTRRVGEERRRITAVTNDQNESVALSRNGQLPLTDARGRL